MGSLEYIQLATDKVYSAATTLTFPGTEMDSVAQELQLPIPLVKLVYLKELYEINSWSKKKGCVTKLVTIIYM